jgi:hypothetical protein
VSRQRAGWLKNRGLILGVSKTFICFSRCVYWLCDQPVSCPVGCVAGTLEIKEGGAWSYPKQRLRMFGVVCLLPSVVSWSGSSISKATNLLQPTRRHMLRDNIFQHTITLKFPSLLAYCTVTIVRFV